MIWVTVNVNFSISLKKINATDVAVPYTHVPLRQENMICRQNHLCSNTILIYGVLLLMLMNIVIVPP